MAMPRGGDVRRWPPPRWYALLVAIGIVMRVAQYLANRSLWIDEAYLALNIIRRDFRGLLLPLDDGQGAPIGFLMAEKLAVTALGPSEYALRLVPLGASIAALVLFARLAERCVSRTAGLIAVALLAIADPLIYYASEAKQYSSDVLCAVVLLRLCLAIGGRDVPSGTLLTLYGLVGAAAILFSHPAVFVLASSGLWLAWRFRRDPRTIYGLGGVAAVWAVTFGVVYLVSLRHLAASTGLLGYWRDAFMPLPPRSLKDAMWLPENVLGLLKFPVGLPQYGVALLVFVVGAATMLRSRNAVLPVTLLTIALVLLASAAGKYPFSGRFLLFVVPCVLLVVAEGVSAMLFDHAGTATIAGITAAFLLFFQPTVTSIEKLVHPRQHEEIRPLLDYYRAHRRDGDALYVYHGARPAFDFYAERYGITDFIRGIKPRGDLERYASDVAVLRGRGRVWVLFSHVRQSQGIDEERFLLYLLDHVGARRDEQRAVDGALYLYDLGGLAGDGSPRSK
jgi:hypothetical protein